MALTTITTAPNHSIFSLTVLNEAKRLVCTVANSSGSISRCNSEDRLRNSTPKITPIRIIRVRSCPPSRKSSLKSSTDPPSIAAISSVNLPASGSRV